MRPSSGWKRSVTSSTGKRRLFQEGKEPTTAGKMIGDFAPKLVDLTDRVLFGDVWERPELSKRDRSLITVAALIA